MQKVIYFNDIKQINAELENGWEITEVYAEKGLALAEKKEQQIIWVNQGSGAQHNKLDAALGSGWKIKRMECVSSAEDCGGCFVWLEK